MSQSLSQSPRGRLSWKAILSGFALDFIGSQIASAIVVVPFAAALAARAVPVEQIEARLYSSSTFLLFIFVISSVFTIAGAYLAAHMAPGDEIRHALAVGVIGLLLGVVALSAQPKILPIWYNIAAFALILPCAYLGGTLRRIRPRRAPLDSVPRPPIPLP